MHKHWHAIFARLANQFTAALAETRNIAEEQQHEQNSFVVAVPASDLDTDDFGGTRDFDSRDPVLTDKHLIRLHFDVPHPPRLETPITQQPCAPSHHQNSNKQRLASLPLFQILLFTDMLAEADVEWRSTSRMNALQARELQVLFESARGRLASIVSGDPI